MLVDGTLGPWFPAAPHAIDVDIDFRRLTSPGGDYVLGHAGVLSRVFQPCHANDEGTLIVDHDVALLVRI